MPEHYELEPTTPPPDLPGIVDVRGTAGEVADAIAADLYLHATNCVRQFGDFHMAVPRGRSAITLYRTLLIDPAYRDMPWKRTHLWTVSARADENETEENIRDLLVQHGDIPNDQFHPMPAGEKDADVRYAKALREHLGWREKGHDRLDYVLLGMGEDASTAEYLTSEMTHADADDLVIRHDAESEAISLSLRLINAARFIAVIVTGERKKAGIERLLSSERHDSPLSKVSPVGGVLKWYLDEAACPGGKD